MTSQLSNPDFFPNKGKTEETIIERPPMIKDQSNNKDKTGYDPENMDSSVNGQGTGAHIRQDLINNGDLSDEIKKDKIGTSSKNKKYVQAFSYNNLEGKHFAMHKL